MKVIGFTWPGWVISIVFYAFVVTVAGGWSAWQRILLLLVAGGFVGYVELRLKAEDRP